MDGSQIITTSVTSSLFSENSAGTFGGVIHISGLDAGNITIKKVNFMRNIASQGSLTGQPLLTQKARKGLVNEVTSACPRVEHMTYQSNFCVYHMTVTLAIIRDSLDNYCQLPLTSNLREMARDDWASVE